MSSSDDDKDGEEKDEERLAVILLIGKLGVVSSSLFAVDIFGCVCSSSEEDMEEWSLVVIGRIPRISLSVLDVEISSIRIIVSIGCVSSSEEVYIVDSLFMDCTRIISFTFSEISIACFTSTEHNESGVESSEEFKDELEEEGGILIMFVVGNIPCCEYVPCWCVTVSTSSDTPCSHVLVRRSRESCPSLGETIPLTSRLPPSI